MNSEKLHNMMRAHTMGVEDAKTAFKHIIVGRLGLSEEATQALVSLVDNIVVLPTRLLQDQFTREQARDA
jgi:hypothetical protein